MDQRTPTETGAATSRRTRQASRSLDDIGAEVSQQVDELRGRFDEALERTVALVRERPGTALLVAVGVGYLVGRIVRS